MLSLKATLFFSCRIGAPGSMAISGSNTAGRSSYSTSSSRQASSAAASVSATTGGDPLADEAHDIVEDVGVVGIDQMILVRRRRVELARHVLPGEHGDHARHGHRLVALDRLDARMRMRRAQHFQMQRAVRGNVERVARLSGDDRLGERIAQAPAAGFLSRGLLLDIDHAVQRIVDRVIAGAAAKIALQHMRQILARGLVEGRRGHDHACGAEAALKGLRIEKRLLHLVQLAV